MTVTRALGRDSGVRVHAAPAAGCAGPPALCAAAASRGGHRAGAILPHAPPTPRPDLPGPHGLPLAVPIDAGPVRREHPVQRIRPAHPHRGPVRLLCHAHIRGGRDYGDADTVGAVYGGLARCWYGGERGLDGGPVLD